MVKQISAVTTCRSVTHGNGQFIMSPQHPCALCAAMLRSGFPSTCPPDQARFSRDKRVCDTCLSTDFVSSPIPDFLRALFRYSFFVAWPFAYILAFLFLRHLQLQGWKLQFGIHGVAMALSLGLVLNVFLGFRLYILLRDRTYARRKPAEALREAERFYYLAIWAALTERKACSKKMLKQAKQMGFADSSRLNDQTIARIAA